MKPAPRRPTKAPAVPVQEVLFPCKGRFDMASLLLHSATVLASDGKKARVSPSVSLSGSGGGAPTDDYSDDEFEGDGGGGGGGGDGDDLDKQRSASAPSPVGALPPLQNRGAVRTAKERKRGRGANNAVRGGRPGGDTRALEWDEHPYAQGIEALMSMHSRPPASQYVHRRRFIRGRACVLACVGHVPCVCAGACVYV